VAVLDRPRLRKYGITGADVEDVVVLFGAILPDVEVEVDLRDPNDPPMVAAAVASAADAIVTGDRDLLEGEGLGRWLSERHIAVYSPRNLLRELEVAPE
jgi:putative PIN family toxin of toxin-antitoxin system